MHSIKMVGRKLAYAILLVLMLFHGFKYSSALVGNQDADATMTGMRCIERERLALLAFKQGLMVDIKREILTSWGSAIDCCSWEGVYCNNQTGHVIQLHLHYKFLQGTVSPKLIELQQLEYLDLSLNDFNGSQIPEVIGSLPNLRYLDLGWASFGGRIPYQLGNLTKLEHLDLNFNPLLHADTLSWLTPLSSINYLDLSFTNLSKVFDWLETINKLPSLRNLTLSICDLPPPMSFTLSLLNASKSLARIDLSGNYGVVTPSTLKWLRNYNSTLSHLTLSSTGLRGLVPTALHNMTYLQHVGLSFNQLEGEIPHSFAKLCGLQGLYINQNNLSGQIFDFVQILSTCPQSSLKDLYLDGNKLTGTIPHSIGQMSKLEVVRLGNNSFEGVITQTHFSKLFNLKQLDLSSNSLALDFHSDWIPPFQLKFILLGSCMMGPHFPEWIRTQNNVVQLDISNGAIAGILPSWFWDLFSNVLTMDLSSNQLEGTIADSSVRFAYNPQVNFSWNQFGGPVPSFFTSASSLDLSNNKFSNLESFLCPTNLSYLTFLDLSSNHLSSDQLPDCWIHFERLRFLDLSNNTLSGRIPTTMSTLSSINTMKLNNNRFWGELPSSLDNCTKLGLIDLGENNFSGLIPKWLGVGLPNLTVIILRSNHFNGTMPLELCHLAFIQILDFSVNDLSGSIPECLNNLTTLATKGYTSLTIHNTFTSSGYNNLVGFAGDYDNEVSFIWKGTMSKYKTTLGLVKRIDLSSNKLTGQIPSGITTLVGLISLNLSGNFLKGEISQDIGKLQSLDSLDLSSNQLEGRIPISLAWIYQLSFLNLSYNNLFGEIPIGPQLQTFDAAYEGNPQLCGPPLHKACPQDDTNPHTLEADDELITKEFYFSMGLGFVVGFWGVCGSLIFNRSWRYAYIKFITDIKDWFCRLCLRLVLISRRLKHMLLLHI
ncbi:receptor-like protein EIX2 [Argentina anserina]|uniref:receptor-like protein EIX2 n=1 Tax=Argentina anserina TaxID=57926 RepID=UPI0021761E31|nr:receptor-like protein EIX2 [Potentilla anserina]